VDLQYYRLERVHSGAIDLKQGEVQAIKGPTEVGTGKAKDEKTPLSEIIDVLNERFGTEFTEEDRLFFQQIKEKAVKNEHVIQTALAKSDRQVWTRYPQVDRGFHDRAYGRERQNRDALHG